jgi:CspA family cold shock protein
MSTSVSETTSPVRYTGRVKWFNNKAGYGFVTVTDGLNAGNDIFIHHSSIKVVSEQYKYLVQGEYIEFECSATTGGEHEVQAGNVSGINGGKLMCETRSDTRVSRTHYKSESSELADEVSEHVRTVRVPTSVRAPGSVRDLSDNNWRKQRTTRGQGQRTAEGQGQGQRTSEGGRREFNRPVRT